MVVGHVFWIGRITPEAWPLLVDNSFQFYACDVCSDRVFEIARSSSAFIEEVYRVADTLDTNGFVRGVVTLDE